METWTWMNKILLCMKHMLVCMDMEWNSFRIRKNWNTRATIYIKAYLCTVVEGGFYVLINDTYCFHGWEDISDIWEAAAMTENFHIFPGAVERFIFSQGMISHQCGEWSMFILWKYKYPPLGLNPSHRIDRRINQQLYYGIINLTTYLWYLLNIHLPFLQYNFIAPLQRKYGHNYCAQGSSKLVQRELCVHNCKWFFVLSVM